MAELKPCPFCGGTKLGISEKSVARDYGTMVQYQVAVYCKDCNTYGPRVLTEKIKSNAYPRPFVDFEKSESKASEAWNRRAGDGNDYYKKQSSCTTPDGKEWFASGGG